MSDEGAFIEIDDEDPFKGVELVAKTEDGVGITVGKLFKGNGRYEVRKVGDGE